MSWRLTVAIAMAFDVTTGSLPPAKEALFARVRPRVASGAVPPRPPSASVCAPPSHAVRPPRGLACVAKTSPADGSTLWL